MRTKISLFIVAVLATPLSAFATPISFGFTSGGLGASATFDSTGSDLIVYLANTGTADALVPTDILTAVFFEVAGNPALSRTSAVVPVTSEVYEIGPGTLVTPGDRVVGGEWAFLITDGISSTGLGIFGAGDRFPGANLQGPASPDGIQLGLAPSGDNLTTGNGGLSGQWLVKNEVKFTLGGFSGDPYLAISHVVFQYGTALDEPQYPADDPNIPEPSSFILAALSLIGLAAVRWRRKR